MPNQFFSPEGDLENYFVTEYWLIDQYIGDELWAWGSGSSGQLGNASTINVSTPVTTFAGGTNWKQVSNVVAHTAAIKTDGTLWTWGNNFGPGGVPGGQLGNAATGNRSTPVTTFAGGNNWKQVSSGGYCISAIKTDGTLWVWGNNGSGHLGNAVTTNTTSTPVTTFAGGTNWKQVSVANNHMAAIKTDGTLWIWGAGSSGQLGNAVTAGVISTPVTTFAGGTNWKQVSCTSGNHTAAIKTDGTLWTWGNNNAGGRLGNATTTNASTPITTFAGGTNWKQVDGGYAFMAAIKTDGTLWTWGQNSNDGRLGINTTINTSTPVTTFAGGTNWKQLSCDSLGVAAIKTDGTLWIWGNAFNGRLGTVSGSSSFTPITTFAGGTNWKQVFSSNTPTATTAGINAEYPLS